MTTITSTPVYSWMTTYSDAALGFVEKRYLLAGHMLGIYMYGPGKRGPEDEWRRVHTFTYNSPEGAREAAINMTELDERVGHTMFGPMTMAEMGIDHESWASLADEDVQGTGEALTYVQEILYNVQTFGTELG